MAPKSQLKNQARMAAANFFNSTRKSTKIDIHDDSEWPRMADAFLGSVGTADNEYFELHFLLELARLFRVAERVERSFYHKGQQYWRIGFIYLRGNEFKKAIRYFRLSRREDQKRNKNQFTASVGVLRLLEPLWMNHARRSALNFFASLSSDEMRDFVKTFSENHNNYIVGRYTRISWSATQYRFVKRPTVREIIKAKYEEINDLYFRQPLSSNYGAVFVIGSILEGLLDDLFTRDNYRIWDEYKNYFGEKAMYPLATPLGTKIDLLRKLSVCKGYPVPKNIILWMVMIQEYRNLIHPNKEYSSQIYSADSYVCAMLFSSLANIAHYWWPKNQLKPT